MSWNCPEAEVVRQSLLVIVSINEGDTLLHIEEVVVVLLHLSILSDPAAAAMCDEFRILQRWWLLKWFFLGPELGSTRVDPTRQHRLYYESRFNHLRTSA